MASWSGFTRTQCNELYASVLADKDVAAIRRLCLEDLFFLLTVAMRRQDMDRDWLYARCREVEANPDGYLDLWAREHYKSTIITYGLTIQDILKDSSVTVGIFSHTRPIAKAFLSQIKTELETNTFLQNLFPDVLYKNPERESPSWSLDGGIIVKRQSNPKEKTVEAWGLVDGQPTSKHFRILVYDDVVTIDSVTSPDMMAKTDAAWALSLSLGAVGGSVRTIGTRYHFNDTYKTMLDRGAAILRRHSATVSGEIDGEPVLFDRETLDRKRREMGPYISSCQLFLNPVADEAQGFKQEWLEYYESAIDPRGMNIYCLVDPANEKKKTSDFTVLTVIGLGPDNNYYLLYGVRDRLNLTQRTELLFSVARRYRLMNIGYEQYGMQADIQHIQYVQQERNFRFHVTKLGGVTPKPDRIRKLIPAFEQGRFFIPRRMMFKGSDGRAHDFIHEFVNDEFMAFPVGVHDDMLDCIARILDPELGATFPKIETRVDEYRKTAYLTKHQYAVLP
jgi:predicted phage terminase large subunit-like protein